MSLAATTLYAVECDNCAVKARTFSTSQSAAARYALSIGWQAAVDGEDPGADLCPECLAEVAS